MVDGKILIFLLVFQFPSDEMLIAHKISGRQHFANPFDAQTVRFWEVLRVPLLAYHQLNRTLNSCLTQEIVLTFDWTRIFIGLIAQHGRSSFFLINSFS